jgi:hypothetical protein
MSKGALVFAERFNLIPTAYEVPIEIEYLEPIPTTPNNENLTELVHE